MDMGFECHCYPGSQDAAKVIKPAEIPNERVN